MSLEIHSKSGLNFSMGYGGFLRMRNALMESLMPGFGVLHWWAVMTGYRYIPFLNEKGWTEDGNRIKYEISCVSDATPEQFKRCCNEVLYAWCKANKLTAFWDLLICHSDCAGKLTAVQCRRLIKDLDKFPPESAKDSRDKFIEFRELVRSAANNNETLFF